MSDEGPTRRRRRRRATAPQGTPPPSPPQAQGPAAPPPTPSVEPTEDRAPKSGVSTRAGRPGRPPRPSAERGLRDLVGAGPSQLGVSGALRGRDVNRPTDDDLARAERDLVLVRRNWKPAGDPSPGQR